MQKCDWCARGGLEKTIDRTKRPEEGGRERWSHGFLGGLRNDKTVRENDGFIVRWIFGFTTGYFCHCSLECCTCFYLDWYFPRFELG